jgi:hypothetical protein
VHTEQPVHEHLAVCTGAGGGVHGAGGGVHGRTVRDPVYGV